MLACLPGEHHALGLTAFGVALRDRNWSVTYMRRDTPLESVRHAADAVQADAIVLCASLQHTLAAARDDVAELAATYPVMVGGPATRAAATPPGAQVLPWDLLMAAQVLTLRTPEHARPAPAEAQLSAVGAER